MVTGKLGVTTQIWRSVNQRIRIIEVRISDTLRTALKFTALTASKMDCVPDLVTLECVSNINQGAQSNFCAHTHTPSNTPSLKSYIHHWPLSLWYFHNIIFGASLSEPHIDEFNVHNLHNNIRHPHTTIICAHLCAIYSRDCISFSYFPPSNIKVILIHKIRLAPNQALLASNTPLPLSHVIQGYPTWLIQRCHRNS